MNLKTPILEVSGIGEHHARLLETLGIYTIEDFLWHLPRRWDDFSNVQKINQIKPEQKLSIFGKIVQIENKRLKGGKYLTQALVSDETGLLKVVWFNQPYLTKNIHVDDELVLGGKVDFSYGSIQMQNPSYEMVSDEEGEMLHTGRIVPIYPETAGITSKWLRSKIKPLMKYIYSIKDYLPESVKKEEGLIDLPAAIRQMHFPENEEQLDKAKDRLAFDEMFLLQTAVLNSKKRLKQNRSVAVPFDEDLIKKFVQDLGFELTVAQRKAAWDILRDIALDRPMNRLLQGDVGSGKTVVAAIALLEVASADSQGSLLCPTEILAKQHYSKICHMLEPFGVKCVLLTGSTPRDKREEIITQIKEGEAKVIIGTHALLESKVEFWRLGLAIVDEQHRFGVKQRSALRRENLNSSTVPHFLAMTATPIPRTLSLTVYGDLDISIIYEMPPGRQRVITKIVPELSRSKSYEFIRKAIDDGRQAYVVCPLVNDQRTKEIASSETPESVSFQDSSLSLLLDKSKLPFSSVTEASDAEHKSVMSEYEKLSHKVFPGISVGFIHGQLKTAEKELAMSKFISGQTKILVSSSVIEVGIDAPNATIIVVENAEQFGLAQLHQLRGRVGRGSHQSYCLLFTSSNNPDSLKRLQALVETDNGFRLADADLLLRGPGDFVGGRQHGLPDISMKNLMNLALISRCREAAKRFLANDDLNNHPLLQAKASKYDSVLTLE